MAGKQEKAEDVLWSLAFYDGKSCLRCNHSYYESSPLGLLGTAIRWGEMNPDRATKKGQQDLWVGRAGLEGVVETGL